MTITKPAVVKAIGEIVAEQPDKVARCVYAVCSDIPNEYDEDDYDFLFNEGIVEIRPECVVGHYLVRELNFELPWLVEESNNAEAVLENSTEAHTPQATAFLVLIQRIQDNGVAWQRAYDLAVEYSKGVTHTNSSEFDDALTNALIEAGVNH